MSMVWPTLRSRTAKGHNRMQKTFALFLHTKGINSKSALIVIHIRPMKHTQNN